MMKKQLLSLLLCSMLHPVFAEAGTACTEKPQSAETVQKAFQLAIKTREALDASGAEVALVGRVGQDLSKYNLRYSHMAFVWRDHPQGRWLAVHELNQCGTANSALFNEGLANFFFDDMFAWDALIVTPSPNMQAKIVALLKNTAYLKHVHEPHYNMVAHPFSTKYQNSNQWVLEILSSAMSEELFTSRSATQTWLKQANFKPSVLRIPTLKRLGGRMFQANVAFDDHPNADRFAGNIAVVTVESVKEFVKQQDSAVQELTVSLQ